MSRSRFSSHISPEEWRWVILVSGLLATVTLVPYAWALASNSTAPDAQFMGMLANPRDGATYLAKMQLGYQGDVLFHLSYTPEPHDGSALFIFYIFLGYLAKLSGLSSIEIFHIVRVLGGLFMYIALYQLGATVWTRTRPRRFFFGLTAVGSGLGWLIIVLDSNAIDLTTNRLLPDLNMPEAFPLYAVYANPHFPIAIGLLALVGSIYLQVFRPGIHEEPAIYNQGLILVLASLALAVVLPHALVPIGFTLGAYLIVRLVQTRRAPLYEASWCIPLWFSAAPFLVYYLTLTQANPAINAWNEQNVTPSPPPHYYLAGFAPLLIVALPGIGRAVRNFEPDGDQLMLTWLSVNVVLLYAPINVQRRFTVGLIIPVVYFAVRGLEDYWSITIPKRLWRPALIVLFVILLPSNVFAMGVPLFGAVVDIETGIENNLLLESAYRDTLGFLYEEVPLETDGHPTVILASPAFSMFIPAWSGQRVVYGHPYETIDAEEKENMVRAWYQGERCQELLDQHSWHNEHWQVDYVVVGPRERVLGDEEDVLNPDACYNDPDLLGQQVGIFGDVVVYKAH